MIDRYERNGWDGLKMRLAKQALSSDFHRNRKKLRLIISTQMPATYGYETTHALLSRHSECNTFPDLLAGYNAKKDPTNALKKPSA